MYRTLNTHYQEKFGCKVYKLAIDGGFTCPNRDGTAGSGGCIFCSAYGGGEFAENVCDEFFSLPLFPPASLCNNDELTLRNAACNTGSCGCCR